MNFSDNVISMSLTLGFGSQQSHHGVIPGLLRFFPLYSIQCIMWIRHILSVHALLDQSLHHRMSYLMNFGCPLCRLLAPYIFWMPLVSTTSELLMSSMMRNWGSTTGTSLMLQQHNLNRYSHGLQGTDEITFVKF